MCGQTLVDSLVFCRNSVVYELAGDSLCGVWFLWMASRFGRGGGYMVFVIECSVVCDFIFERV